MLGAEGLLDAMFSCPTDASAVAEGQCVWSRAEFRTLNSETSADRIGFSENGYALTVGGQRRVGENLYAGGALQYDKGNLNTVTGAGADTDRLSAGVVLKYQPGPYLVAGALNIGTTDVEMTRRFALLFRSTFRTCFGRPELLSFCVFEPVMRSLHRSAHMKAARHAANDPSFQAGEGG